MDITQNVLNYIIEFLLRNENKQLCKYVIYSDLPKHPQKNAVYIKPSAFFDKNIYMTENSLPNKSVSLYNETPILFGDNIVIREKEYSLLEADIIASTFFLITRYEEYINLGNKDDHGRYIGKQSILYKLGVLDKPIVEDYGRILRNLLRNMGHTVKEPRYGFSHIYFTHDIDVPWSAPNNIIGYIKRIMWNFICVLKNDNRKKCIRDSLAILGILKDPVDTFDWIIKMDKILKNTYGKFYDTVYFLMTCSKGKHDQGYIVKENKVKQLMKKLIASGAIIGLHISYSAGVDPRNIKKEQEQYEITMKHKALCARHHYLMSRNPDDMKYLIEAGIKEDFTMCYADGGGYRLGTCRAVHWINPQSMEVTDLVLHPMLATEGKLYPKEYMGMSTEEIISFFDRQFKRICQENGELTVLFHNTSFDDMSVYPYKELYKSIIELLCEERFHETNNNMQCI